MGRGESGGEAISRPPRAGAPGHWASPVNPLGNPPARHIQDPHDTAVNTQNVVVTNSPTVTLSVLLV
jgi:hypothetical protein